MAAELVIIAGPDKGCTFPITPGDPLLIGRSRNAQNRLTDPSVSRAHCQVKLEGERAVLIDLDSAGGTFVNNQRVTQHPLRTGDVIRIGQTQLRFQTDPATESPTNLPATPVPNAGKPAFLPVERLHELAGTALSHFEIGPMLAKGTSGIVFKARDTKHGTTVALKVLWPESTRDEDEIQRFIRAMKTMMPLRHPNLVTLLGAGKTGPYCWIAMEFVEGESLTQVIGRISANNMLDWKHTLRVAVYVGQALEFAHQHHIVHRAVAPQNILVGTSAEQTKLGDLMLAKALEGSMAKQITRPGEVLGDVRFMSPEQTSGTGAIDHRSDIYSLGATVYALLTGHPPLEGKNFVETILKIRQAEPAKPKQFQPAIPDAFEATVLKMLAKQPEDRQQTVKEVLAELERVAKGQGVKI